MTMQIAVFGTDNSYDNRKAIQAKERRDNAIDWPKELMETKKKIQK